MLQLEEARERIVAAVRALPPERVSLTDATHRILAADLTAAIDLPVFDNSAMDGYAVRAADLKAASADHPVRLRITVHIPAGARKIDATIDAGQCARIFTGSAMPAGADAVVMQEDVVQESELAIFCEAVKPWENVRFRGEDVRAGAVVIKARERITAAATALLGALGVSQIAVHRRPSVAILATGNELREAGQALQPGEIYESNRAAVAALLGGAGAMPRLFPLVPDTLDETRKALRRAFDECDVVVTSGGVSVGELDFVKEAFRELGGTVEFWRVAIRPGKPFVFGLLGEKLLCGLPGNPVSAFVTAAVLVWPVILRLQGAREVELPTQFAIANDAFVNKTDRRHLMRVRVDGDGHVSLAGLQASHALGSLGAANGLVDVPAGGVIERGATVRVMRFAP
jgi:molybdopterin molybdotransferase